MLRSRRHAAAHRSITAAVLLVALAAWTGACPGAPDDDDATAADDDAPGDDDDVTDDDDDSTAGDDDATADDDDDVGGDEALLRAAIAGEHDAADALDTVAASGGLPVETAGGDFLFACLCDVPPDGGAWMLAGDHDGWVGEPMARSGALWWIERSIPAPDGSLYKFTDGDRWTSDPQGRRFGFDEFGEHSLVRASAAHLERWYDVEGEGLRPRDLQVWVPDGGVFTHLLIAHDGQNLFAPDAMMGGWRLHESLPAGVLVAGVDNTVDRMEEYTHTTDILHGQTYGGQGDAYADLIEGTVRPLVEAAYGTADVVGLMGSSLGGLISLHIARRYPGRYRMALSLSGTVGWGSIGAHNPTMVELLPADGLGTTALYLDSGGGGSCVDADGDGVDDDDPTNEDNYCENAQLRDALVAVGYQLEIDLWHWWEPGAPHNEIAWADRVWRPLELFAGQ